MSYCLIYSNHGGRIGAPAATASDADYGIRMASPAAIGAEFFFSIDILRLLLTAAVKAQIGHALHFFSAHNAEHETLAELGVL
jgi:hypothetical protein